MQGIQNRQNNPEQEQNWKTHTPDSKLTTEL